MTTNSPSLHYKLDWIGLGKILATFRLRVPPHQRSFSWTLAEFTDFWDDLQQSMERDESTYFFGPIILSAQSGREGPFTVIDGQQRLATTSILLASIRDVLKGMDDSERADQIQRDYLGSRDLRTRDVTPTLLLNEDDVDFFRRSVSEATEDVPEPRRQSNRRIREAREFFLKKLSEFEGEDREEKVNWLLDWVGYVVDKAVVMLAVVPAESDAYVIFETLNARGRELAIADLLKNHLFGTARDSLNEVKIFWQLAEQRISDVDEQAIPGFLRHFWNSQNELVREKDLYRAFRDEIQNQNHCERFAVKLEECSAVYAAILNPRHSFWRELDSSVEKAFEVLFDFKLEQNRPFLIAAMQELDRAELDKVIRSLLPWSVRGLVVGGIGKGHAELTYSNAARAIRSNPAMKAEQVLQYLSPIIPANTEFENSFATYSPPRNKRSHYLLRTLEASISNETEPYLVVNPSREELTLEHILPQNPKPQEWPRFEPDQISEYAKRLGNLVLIPRRLNRLLGNKSFDEKHSIYTEADIEITKSVAEFGEWSPQAIEERQRKLARIAVSAWPRAVV